jgi:hypothetical protein
MGWLLFLLEPLSSTGLAFPFFLVTFAITIVFGVVSLALVLTSRPVNLLRILAWLAYPFAAATLVLLFLSSQSPSNPSSASASTSASQRSRRPPGSRCRTRHSPHRRGWGSSPSTGSTSIEERFGSCPMGAGSSMNYGLAYVPGPMPEGRSKTRVKHLAGPWYHLYSVF